MSRTDLTWQDNAACLGLHHIFDASPYGNRKHRSEQVRQRVALAICRQCPVITECWTWAIHHYEDDDAIIGGTTGHERRQQRRQQGLNRPPTRGAGNIPA